MTEFEKASQQFLACLTKSGADISNKIELKDLRNQQAGRGVIAVQEIEEDELLFRIPRSSILSVENSILSTEIPKTTFEQLGPWLSLILVMLYEYENKEASNWAAYFNVLPTEFNTLMFWETDELDKLQASAVRDKIGKTSADETFKNDLVPVIKEFAEIFFSGDAHAKERAEQMEDLENLQLMHRMGTLIMAYAFDVEPAEPNKDVDEEGYASEDEDEALPKGMVPLADMLNADADRNNARLFYEENSLSMKALKPIRAGEEIFNDYGSLPRSDLLRRYGYITDNYAQYDVVEIPFELITQRAKQIAISSFEDRLEYLDDQGLIEAGYDITTSAPFDIQDSFSPELIVLVKSLLLPNAEFERLKSKSKLPKPENIGKIEAQCLLSIIKARAEQYATSLEDDTRDPVAVPSITEYTAKERRYAMARVVRIGEKKILKAASEALTRLIEAQADSSGADKRSAESPQGALSKKQKVR